MGAVPDMSNIFTEVGFTSADSTVLRRAYACFPSGVTAVCAMADGSPVGMAVSSFTPVSLRPPLVSIFVQRSSTTWPTLRGQRRLGVSVLAEQQDALCRQLSSRSGDRFADTEWQETADGAVLLQHSAAWFDCSLYRELPTGDHLLVLLQIYRLWVEHGVSPLVFHHSQFRRLAGNI